MSRPSFKFNLLAYVLGLLAVYAAGAAIRYHVLSAQYQEHGRDLPFTLESAIHYSFLEAFDLLGAMPRHEYGIEYPEGVDLWATYSIGSEYVIAPLARLLPGSLPFPEQVRIAYILWFCLGVPCFALWMRALGVSRLLSLASALLYAVSLSSVVRSTGQEISRENFALPLLIAHLAAQAWAGKAPARGARAALVAASALALGASMFTWDMIQFYLILWALPRWVRALRGEPVCTPGWWAHVGVLLLVGLANPYLRSHGFLQSPALLLCYGSALVAISARWPEALSAEGLRRVRWGLALAPLVLGLLLAQLYSAHYGHFADLLAAKLRFLNVKPSDPLLLTFNQRILWVPALHSATWGLTRQLFPVLLLASSVAGLLAVLRADIRRRADAWALLVPFAASLAAYVLFVRFHVFLAIFAVALIGYVGSSLGGRRWWREGVVAGVLLVFSLAEASPALNRARAWGRGNVYYPELRGLTEWMAEHAAPEAVAANFTVSAPIFAYAGCPVVMHPKFETPGIRERVRTYVETLFKGSEEDFRDWMERHGARYYVHSMGEFSTLQPDAQMRYFAGALNPSEDAAARLFEFRPEECAWFQMVWGNRKYRVFKVRFERDVALARDSADRARAAFEQGRLAQAEALARESLALNPVEQEALRILSHVDSLRSQGFGEAGDDHGHEDW